MIYTLTLNPAIDKEYQVPLLEMDKVLRATSVNVDYGGKGLNVSRMLATLGTASTAVGFLGGHSGEILREGIENLGIHTDFIPIKDETRTNVSIVDSHLNHHIKVNEAGPVINADNLTELISRITTLAKKGDHWVLAGSLPPGVPDEIYARIITILKKAGAFAILDSSGVPLKLGCQAGPFLIKPNVDELSQLTGKELESAGDIANALPDLFGFGISLTIISAGKKGAFLSDGENIWQGVSPKITEHNPVGAGDAMVAGVVWKLSQGEDAPTALKWGLACGAAAASQPGTSMANKNIINELVSNTKVELMKNAL